jgi:hypothetical protein
VTLRKLYLSEDVEKERRGNYGRLPDLKSRGSFSPVPPPRPIRSLATVVTHDHSKSHACLYVYIDF